MYTLQFLGTTSLIPGLLTELMRRVDEKGGWDIPARYTRSSITSLFVCLFALFEKWFAVTLLRLKLCI